MAAPQSDLILRLQAGPISTTLGSTLSSPLEPCNRGVNVRLWHLADIDVGAEHVRFER